MKDGFINRRIGLLLCRRRNHLDTSNTAHRCLLLWRKPPLGPPHRPRRRLDL